MLGISKNVPNKTVDQRTDIPSNELCGTSIAAGWLQEASQGHSRPDTNIWLGKSCFGGKRLHPRKNEGISCFDFRVANSPGEHNDRFNQRWGQAEHPPRERKIRRSKEDKIRHTDPYGWWKHCAATFLKQLYLPDIANHAPSASDINVVENEL